MDNSKLASAKAAVLQVKRGMSIGLGTGSTAEIFIDLLGERNRNEQLSLTCIATSIASEYRAKKNGLALAGFSEIASLDAAFDGADQIDSNLNLIKGLGGALVREKIVDYRASKFFVMVGENKLVEKLHGVVPGEVIPLAEEAVKRDLVKLGAQRFETRMDGRRKFISDNSNLILHVQFGEIKNPGKLEDGINSIAGVVDNGIFAGKKPIVFVGSENGGVRTLK
jgi:ribose 5-phosphate isomerase A